MQVIIPLSGTGQRFTDAGYTDIKPLIRVMGKPVIEHVVSLFPGETKITFICRQEHLDTTPLREELRRIAPSAKLIAIAGHKLGPVYSVAQIADTLDDTEPVLISYCDYFMRWDYPRFKKDMERNGYDGAIPCYKGFHPHLLGTDLYAGCRTDEHNRLLEIQEKHSFTPDKMDTCQSAGMYFFKNGAYVKKYFRELLDSGNTYNGEYYVSMVYPLMLRDGLHIHVPEVPFFCQWGTPRDLLEFEYWYDIFHPTPHPHPSTSSGLAGEGSGGGIVLIPMAGTGNRFKAAGYSVPKPLIPVSGKPMIVKAVEALPRGEKYVFVCRSEHLENDHIDTVLKKEVPQASFITVKKTTAGQAATCLLAKDLLDNDVPLLIGPCDNGMRWDHEAWQKLISDTTIDAVIWTFRNNPTVTRNPKAYGWVKVNAQNRVEQVSCKVPISDKPLQDHAIIGTFWFRRGSDFVRAAEQMIAKNIRINDEFYVDTVFNELKDLGLNAVVFEIDTYIGWGTPDDLRTYEYWEAFYSK